jgi:Predicted transcriptional regulator
VPFSAPTLWRKVKDGSFPSPMKINGITAWPLSVIRVWQQQVSGGAVQEAVCVMTQ